MITLRNFIRNYTDLSFNDWESIQSSFAVRDFAANEFILREGQRCDYLYFLEAGLARFFITSRGGEEVTKFFTDAPYAFTSQVSFSSRLPSKENIQAIEPCHVFMIHHDDAHALLKIPSWSEFIRKLIQEVQHYTESILLELQTVKAEERYRRMLENNPHFVGRIPLKYLASYLGIQPQSLSRIRKQLSVVGRS